MKTTPLNFQWPTTNPFLFCVHHKDDYPEGNEEMGPKDSLAGRRLGNDFVPKDGWRMYHGEKVPGFPVHPHRGFETITIVLEGQIDHADSLGGAGRYAAGDVQWMTAGAGIQHTEMFPLIHSDKGNPLELFQIWLNLPAADKFVNPYYTMFWNENIPVLNFWDETGQGTMVTLIAGKLMDQQAPPPPPDSYASKPESDIMILLIQMEAEAEWELEAANPNTDRSLYFYRGNNLLINKTEIPSYQQIQLDQESHLHIKNGKEEAFLLLLQGKAIEEKVVQYGPFVMNSDIEIQQAFNDYRKTQFGGWPWDRRDPVHGREKGRFASYGDGRGDKP
ncbi:MAG: pirin family protein [Bacteroidales bacterium]|nr:pirin family protein [Bacteroidales bacterium]MCF8392243.1 pirin family protein [Bacteroidales bacterium]